MRRVDKTLEDADTDIGFLYASERKLKRIQLKIKALDAQIDSYGVSSPQIRSSEEAKYQRGTKIYTSMPLLELFAEQDKLQEEYKTISAACGLIASRLSKVQLTKADDRLLRFLYGRRYTYKQIAHILHYSRQAVMKRHDRILRAYSELQQ